jgi:integrase
MAQRKRGERALGPYNVRGRWRVVVVSPAGARAAREYETEAEARQVVRSVNREVSGGHGRTVAEACEEYEAYLRMDKQNKERSIEVTLWRLGKFFPDAGERLSALTANKCATYYDALRATVAVDTHRNVLAEARTFLKWCVVKKRWLARNPLEGVEGQGRRRHGKEQLRIDEARRWQAKAIELADKGSAGAVAAMSSLLLGMRASEIVTRVVRDLDDDGRLLWIPEAKTEKGRRTLQIPELLRPYLRELAKGRPADAPLFGAHDRHWVRKWVQRICRDARPGGLCARHARPAQHAGGGQRGDGSLRGGGARSRVAEDHVRKLRRSGGGGGGSPAPSAHGALRRPELKNGKRLDSNRFLDTKQRKKSE